MKKKKHFTLIELIIVVIIIAILVTMGIPAYRNVIERGQAEACRINLEALWGAVNTYALENDEVPATLGQLEDRHIRYAFDQIKEKYGSWRVKFAYFIVNFDQRGLVYASTYWSEAMSLECPKAEGANSYGINQAVAGQSLDFFRTWIENNPNQLIIADCDQPTFASGGGARRHQRYRPMRSDIDFGIGITPSQNFRAIGASPGDTGLYWIEEGTLTYDSYGQHWGSID